MKEINEYSDSYEAIVICGNRNLSYREIKVRTKLYEQMRFKWRR